METPNKMMSEMAQPGQMQQNPYPNQNVLGPAQGQVVPNAFGQFQAPGTAFRMEGDSPLDQNAFIGALEDARASGKKSFNVNGNTYPVK